MGPKKKKKLTKEERARMRAEELERIRKEGELEKQRLAREAEERLVAERLQSEERARQEVREQGLRELQLAATAEIIHMCERTVHAAEEERKQQSQLLTQIDDLLENAEAASVALQTLWHEVRQEVRDEQQRRLDEATYGLLRRASRFPPSDTEPGVVRFHHDTSPHLTLSLWATLVAPAPSVALACEFPQLGVSVQLPPQLNGLHAAVRALWLRYDHFSDLCPSREAPPIPEHYSQDLQSLTLAEWQQKLERSAEESKQAKLLEEEQAAAAELEAKNKEEGIEPEPTSPPIPDVNNEELDVEDDDEVAPEPPKDEQAECERIERETMTRATEPCELNLRKFAVLGGVLHLDLLEQPPQPRELSKHLALTVLTEPLELRRVHFHIRYSPPPPPEPGKRRLPEEIEAELKQQEQELEKLALVNIMLPENVLWFEPPIAVSWDAEKQYWNSEDIHDLKFNEEKQILTFRAGRLGPLALAAFRYSNLPYQTWELHPSKNDTDAIIFSITAAVVLVEFTFKDGFVCLSQLQNGSTSALQDIVGQYHKPNILIKLMRRGGVDIFPPHDAHCYMAAVAPKQRPPERHLYKCMALAASTHCFAWSRWNLLAGRNKMVFQMRETYEDEAGKQFYADLLHLLQAHGSKNTQRSLAKPLVPLVHSLATILEATRVFSFS